MVQQGVQKHVTMVKRLGVESRRKLEQSCGQGLLSFSVRVWNLTHELKDEKSVLRYEKGLEWKVKN